MKNFYMVVLCLAMTGIGKLYAQNLVPNPSFENVNCPTGYTGAPAQVSTFVSDWYSATCASPDPFTNCGTTVGANKTLVPNVIFGYQHAQHGNNYMGFGFYNSWYEYLGVKLTQPLEAGETYNVSYWLGCADNMRWAADQIGIYFSTTEIRCYTGFAGPQLNYTPQIVNPVGNFITDTTWQQLTGEFVAAGGEEYIVIGYFKPIVLSDFYLFPDPGNGLLQKANPYHQPTIPATGTATSPRTYYYIDNVSVQKLSALPVKLTAFNARVSNQQALLNWKTLTESNNCRFEIERSTSGSGFKTIADVAGAVNSNTAINYTYTDKNPIPGRSYYRLKQVDCDGKTNYSNVVTVNYTLEGFSIYPNPALQQIIVDRNTGGSAIATIIDFAGRVMASQKVTGTKETIMISQLLPGTYILKLESAKGVHTQKFVKQ